MKEKEKEKEKKREGERSRGGGGKGQLTLPLSPSPQLTERDFAALSWLVEQRAATTSQVTTLLGYLGDGPISPRRGAMLIARWEALGLVERSYVWHRRPAVVSPTTQCAKLMGHLRWRRPAIGTLNHTILTSQVRLQVCRPGSRRRWLTEAQLRTIIPSGGRLPDGAIVEVDGSLTAVEVELTSKGSKRVRENVLSLLALRQSDGDLFHHVLYLCSNETMSVLGTIREELSEPINSRLVVLPCPQA
jgi:hypothetical protein